MNNITNINNQQIQKGNKNNYSLFYIEGIITKYISTLSDTLISDPNVVNRFIVKAPNAELINAGGQENYICIKNNSQYYFFKPEEDTVVILLENSQILYFKNNQWNIIYTFSTGGGGGFVEEPPFDSNKYGRRNNTWVKLDDISDAPINNKRYVRKNSAWELDFIQEDAWIDGSYYGRVNGRWGRVVPEAPSDGKQYARKDGNWEILSIENSGLFVPEAPNDSKYYARKNKAWVEFTVDELNAPNDGKFYGRVYNTWQPVIPEAPKDNKIYARKDGNWEDISFGNGIPDVPNDGKLYSRKHNTWVENLYLLDPPNNGLSYLRKHGQWEIFVDKAFEDVSIDNKLYGRRNKTWEEIKSSPIDSDAPQDNEIYGRKNGTWTKVESAGGGGGGGLIGDHNTASNIQGGKKVGGVTTEAYHLDYEEYNKVPYKPRIIFPPNNSTNINQVPLVELSHYQHPFEYRMLGLHLILSKNPNFAQEHIVYEFNDVYGSNSFQIPLLNKDNNNTLEAGTTYYIRARYMDNKKNYSLWSDVCKFETMIFLPTQLLKTPIITFPSDGGVNNNINPFFVMTSPQVLLGIANFNKSDWQVSTDINFNHIIYEATDQDNLTFHRSINLNLMNSGSVDFFVRGRQKTVDAHYTPYSIPVKFGLENSQGIYDKHVFGLRRTFNENGSHQCYNIDENGDKINLSKQYFDNHPLYQNRIVEVPFDNYPNIKYKMTYIPPIYEKCNVYNDVHGNQIIDLYFSPSKIDNSWWIDPSFISSPGGFYISPNFCILKKMYEVLGVPQNAQNNVDVMYPYTMEEIINGNLKYKPYVNNNEQFNTISISYVLDSYSNLNLLMNNINSPKFKMMSFYEMRLLKDLITAERLVYYTPLDFPEYRNLNYLWSFDGGSGRFKVSIALNNTWGIGTRNGHPYSKMFFGYYKPEMIIDLQNPQSISEDHYNTQLKFFSSDVLNQENNNDIYKASKTKFYMNEIYTGFDDDLKLELALLFIPKKNQTEYNYKYPIKYYYFKENNTLPYVLALGFNQILHHMEYSYNIFTKPDLTYGYSSMLGFNSTKPEYNFYCGCNYRMVKQIS